MDNLNFTIESASKTITKVATNGQDIPLNEKYCFKKFLNKHFSIGNQVYIDRKS